MPRESKAVLDLTEQDFQNISNVTGRIFEIGVHRSDGCLSSVLCPNSEFLKQDLKGKHSWLNASSAKDLSERVRHTLSACVLDPLSTSVCVLTRQAMPIDMSLLKDFRCILTVPKGGLVRQLHEDGSWRIVRSPERLQVLYRPSAADRVSAEAGLLTSKVLAVAASKDGQNKFSRMMFAGRAAATKANILFDTGASANFVSKSFAKQTGITVRPVDYAVRLADDKTMNVAGEATVYVQLGAFHKPVKCYVMDMLYEVDLILGEAFMLKYDCILHYGKGCIMIRKGKRHMTVNSPALPRVQPPVEKEKSDSVLSASQLKRMARKGARVFLAVIRPVESDPVPPVVASVAALSSVPTSVVQPDQPAGPPGVEVPWVSDLLSEFSEVFQDPLPAGLPPERSEGHSIPTEPGHPPPFRSMYRLSPLEYRELEKQVTKFLKDGILEGSFLGLANYFRRFLQGYSKMVVSLTDLTRKDMRFIWTSECQEAFQKVKYALTNASVLAPPELGKPFEVVSDASGVGLRAVLLQEGRPVAFESRKLSPAEQNYTVNEHEMLGVVQGSEDLAMLFGRQRFHRCDRSLPQYLLRYSGEPVKTAGPLVRVSFQIQI